LAIREASGATKIAVSREILKREKGGGLGRMCGSGLKGKWESYSLRKGKTEMLVNNWNSSR